MDAHIVRSHAWTDLAFQRAWDTDRDAGQALIVITDGRGDCRASRFDSLSQHEGVFTVRAELVVPFVG